MDRGSKFSRMASTVLDDGHLKRQPTLKTQASLRKEQSLSALLVTEPSAVFDEMEEADSEDDEAPGSAFACMGANSDFGRGIARFFGHSPTPAYMLMLSLGAIVYISFENLTTGSKSCAVLLAVYFGVSVALLVIVFLVRGFWLGCLKIVYLENRIFPALNELLDPDIWTLVWSLVLDSVWTGYATQVFNTKGKKTGYHRYKLLPLDWPLQYIEDKDVDIIHLCLVVQIFWAFRNVLVEILMYRILLGFLTNFRKPVLKYLHDYALLRKLNAAWIKLTPVQSKVDVEDSLMSGVISPGGGDQLASPMALGRQPTIVEKVTRFIAPKVNRARERNLHVQYTGRQLPTVLDKKNIKSVEVSSVANLLSVQWIKSNPMVLFVEGDRCELVSKRVAKVVARMLFHELLSFRTSLTRTQMEAPSTGVFASPQASIISPSPTEDKAPPPLLKQPTTHPYRISVQSETGQSVTDRIAVSLGIKNVENDDDNTDDEIREELPEAITRRKSIEAMTKKLQEGQPVMSAEAKHYETEQVARSDPYIDTTVKRVKEDRTDKRRSTVPVGRVIEPLDAMPVILQKRPRASFQETADHRADRPATNDSSGSDSGIDFHELNAPVMPVGAHSLPGLETRHSPGTPKTTLGRRFLARFRDPKGNIGRVDTDVTTLDEIKAVQPMTAADKDCLTRDFLALFMKQTELNDLMAMFDYAKHNKITEKSFVRGVMNVHQKRSQMVSSLEAQAEIERVFHRVASMFLTFIMFLGFLIVVGVSTNTIILSGAAALSASGVVLSFVYTDFIVSIILIVFLNPYSIGDEMVLNGTMLKVRRITTYFTEFAGGDGKIVYYSHKQLSTMTLINQSRGLSAGWGFLFKVSDKMTFAQYDYLTNQCKHYLKARPLEWKPDLFIHITNIQPYEFIEINIWVTTIEPWASGSIWLTKSRFMHFVVRQCRLMGLTRGQAILPVELNDKTAGTGGNDGDANMLNVEMAKAGVTEANEPPRRR